jgi:hypothetical protein
LYIKRDLNLARIQSLAGVRQEGSRLAGVQTLVWQYQDLSTIPENTLNKNRIARKIFGIHLILSVLESHSHKRSTIFVWLFCQFGLGAIKSFGRVQIKAWP